MPTNSQRLRSTLSLAAARLASLMHQVWFHPRLDALYPEFLFANYGLTVASAPAMRLAARCCLPLAPDDPLKQWLVDYYSLHADEEDGHAEWLLDDLASLGIPRENVLKRLPYPSIAAAVGAQYYWMQHVHPAAYLGFIVVVETPPDLQFLHDVSRRTGIPLSSMSCHYRHAQLDPEHIAEFDAALDSLPLTPRLQDLITISAITTIGRLEHVFTEALDHFHLIDKTGDSAAVFTAHTTSRA